ncbi:serine carboxypeptidase-like 18 isoform X3 [Gossypium australe]|uniref:Serine carboxypeptidase-like 18 isoform X3 n=1 Tax=Gossypium australe TaxID=47621 RepID=A0A5B6UYQ7_9ROSI|nr:serine carboxypeptidase-like 18 isoform X3 [Gossypium australe]
MIQLLQGYLLGNPFTDVKFDGNSKIIYYIRMTLISDEIYESAKSNCKQEYIDVEISNRMCVKDLQTILEGTIKEWVRCNKSMDYDYDVESVVSYHLCLNTRGYRALIYMLHFCLLTALAVSFLLAESYFLYSGDHSLAVTYVGTESWIKSLNLSIVDDWRPYIVDGQVAGYSREYGNNLTFATIKASVLIVINEKRYLLIMCQFWKKNTCNGVWVHRGRTVGDVEFFYYFIELESKTSKDPLILWLTGGPGCSALSGLFLKYL